MLIKQILREEILKEEKDQNYKGCLMLQLENVISNWKSITDMIDEDDVYIDPNDDTFGIEKEPHVTIIYGLSNDTSVEDLKEITKEFGKNITLTINKISLFENEDYDVVKFDVESEDLHKLHDLVKKLPNKETYPDYHPHITIGYILKNHGKKYIKKFKPFEIKANTFKYSISHNSEGIWKI